MEHALSDLAAYMHEREGVRNRLFMAMAYPLILAVVGIGVVLFLMSYVVPQLLAVLESSGRPLPTATVFLKAGSDLMFDHWLVLLCILAGSGALGLLLHRWPRGRRFVHECQLRLPVIGILSRKALVAQFAQMMSLLLSSGVVFLEAVGLVRTACRNLVLSEELSRMESAVQRGSDIAPALEGSRVFPPLVIHVVNVGQKSGELTEMLSQLSRGYETEVRVAIGKFSAVIEPILIVVMSILVGFIVFATMMPILEATKTIQ
jgi:type II secretory pathway component PulF